MTTSDISRIIEEHITAFEEAKLITPPSIQYEGFNLEQAYIVSDELFKWRCKDGQKSIGRKIGFTNKSIWESHGLGTPIWAHMFEDTVQFAKDNIADISLSGMVLPRIEPEIVFKLKSAPIPTDMGPSDILKHIEWVAIGFEIVDSHYSNWQFSPADAVADFGVHAALVIGSPIKINEHQILELSDQLEEFKVMLFKNKSAVADGVGKNVLGNPALALGYLQNVLNKQPVSAPLAPGEIITTGTLTPALSITSGEDWAVDVSGIGLPSLRIKFTN
jgi:2-oxo-3-hexenedioate decarboxylase